MTFNSISFLLFFPGVTLVYFALPQKAKNLWLLVCSYYFYMSWNPRYVLLIAASTLITWAGGLLIGRENEKADPNAAGRKKLWLILCLVSNLTILGFFKYYRFAANNLQALLGRVGIGFTAPVFDVLLPVGISFYTFQALGYIIDVYQGTIKPEKNLLQYALFISFFPQLVAGPIERSKNLLRQIHEPHTYDSERVTRGLLRMGWGFFKKLVIADRAAIFVNAVYDSYTDYAGIVFIAATVLFAFQIYCDFSGYSDIAIGAAQVLGFTLMENFDAPYLATNIREFWDRWHISLTLWFRDYLYNPVVVKWNRAMAKWPKDKRKRYQSLTPYAGVMLTFLLSGLWHGAAWHYVVWGGINGLFIVAHDAYSRYRKKHRKKGSGKTEKPRIWMQRLQTFVLVCFTDIFFRASGFQKAIAMLRHVVRYPGLRFLLGESDALKLRVEAFAPQDFQLLVVALLLLFVVDCLHGKVALRTKLLQQDVVFRWAVYYGLIFTILIFGVYGPEYNASTFIYFQF